MNPNRIPLSIRRRIAHRPLGRMLTAAWLASCIGASQLPARQGAPLAEVVEKERIVEASRPPAQPWEPVQIGRKLVKREKVAARDLSRAVVRLSNEQLMRVNANTELVVLPSLVSGRPLGLEIKKGEIYLFSRGRREELSLKTPTVEGTPNGTQFRVRVEEDGTTTFTMFEGKVELRNEHGRLTLGNLEQAVIEPGRAPRRTARIDAKNIIQWCLYYPGVLYLPELELTRQDQRDLAKSIEAYGAGDIMTALDRWPSGYEPRSTGARVFRSMLLLAVGQVDDARRMLASVPRRAPGRQAIEEMIDAVNFIERKDLPEPKSAGEWLARSYYEQSRLRLGAALEAARKSSQMAPGFGFAAVRVSELEFSHGRVRQARAELQRGLRLTPRNAQAWALNGFLLSAQNCIGQAISSFDVAIRLDGALGDAWLGRGLCKFRLGRKWEGRQDLQTATILEPNRSLFHSYLGKASSQMGLAAAAEKDLNFAKLLDPKDPTPWLYSSIDALQNNRPGKAVRDMNRSIDLNDNRRLYRSGFLLDEDRAVRNSNLATIYHYNGMDDVAVRQATRAVEYDYTNASAHLFLANSFDALRDPRRISLRYETPWFNELLLANLLSPVGGGPLSQFVSQQEYSKLLESDGLGAFLDARWYSDSQILSTASFFGTYGKVSFGIDVSHFDDNGDRFNSDARRTEIYAQCKVQASPDDVFYFLGKWQDHKSGDNFQTYDNLPLSPWLRFKETQEPGLLLAGWHHRWGPGSDTLFLGGRLAADQTLTDPRTNQLLLQRDTAAFYPNFVHKNVFGFDVFTDPALRFANPPAVSIGPDFQTLIYSPALLQAISPYLGTGHVTGVGEDRFSFATHRNFVTYSAELQHIQQSERNTFIVGGRYQHGHFETDALLSVERPTFSGGFPTPASRQHSNTDFDRTNLYAYDFWHVAPWLTLIGGMTWDRIEHPDNYRNPPINDLQRTEDQLSGKVGFTFAPSDWFIMRGIYSEWLGGVTFDESVRLEPVQLAGFPQAYRTILSESIAGSVEAPHYKLRGLSIEGSLPTGTWWGARFQVIDEDVDRTIGAFDGYDLGVFPITPAYFPGGTTQHLSYREDVFECSLNQLIGDQFALGVGYRIARSKLYTAFPEIPVSLAPGANVEDRATLQELMLNATWNSPTGLFARLEANWYSQDLKDDPRGLPPGARPRPGDSFWQFNAFIGYRFNQNRAEISLGLLNIGDTDYHLSPLNYYGDIARRRTAVLACRMSF